MAISNPYNPRPQTVTDILQQRQAQADAMKSAGTLPAAPAKPENFKVPVLGTEITPDSPNKSFLRKVGEDAAMLSYAIPTGLAQVISHPFTFIKNALVNDQGDVTRGALGQSVRDAVNPDYYKAHPLLGVVNLAGFVAPIAGAAKSAALKTAMRTAIVTGTKEAITAGITEEVAQSAFKETLLKEAVTAASKSGNTAIVGETVKNALLKSGVAEETALKVSNIVADNVFQTFSRQTTKMQVLDAIAHPVGTATKYITGATDPLRNLIFGSPAKTAVAKIYGADVVAKNPEGFLNIERWAEAQTAERGMANTLTNRQRVMNDWVDQNSQWASLNPEERIQHFENYAQQDLVRLKLHQSTGLDIVTTKALPQNYVNSMVETIKNAPANITREELTQMMEETFGNDFKMHSAEIQSAIDAAPSVNFRDAMVESVSKLGDARSLVSFNKFSPEIQQLAKDIEGTGYRIASAPKGKPVSFATDIMAGGITKSEQYQVGITSAQSINPNPFVVEKLNAGNKLFEAGQVKEGLATLQDVTKVTEGELSKTLEDGFTKVSRLETNTHGLYFGNPEPSYWLTVKSGDQATTLSSIAQFAKRNAQESFITARKIATGEAGSYGLTLKFAKKLTEEDVLAIEKIVNDKGIGLTLNQTTGEAIAYNIKQWDGLSPEQFVETAKNVSSALADAGYKISRRLDSYDIGVYTKDTYDQLIEQSSGAVQPGSASGRSAAEQIATRGRVPSGVSGSDIQAARTAVGSWLERFGFSTDAVVEGAPEYAYRQNFTQRLLNDFTPTFGDTIRVKNINRPGFATIPAEKLFQWLDKNKTVIRGLDKTAKDFFSPARTVFDLKEADFVRAGMTPEIARAVQNISNSALREVPTSIIGMADKVVNYIKTVDKGFGKWMTSWYEPYLKVAYKFRYDLSPFFAAQQWLETRINSAFILKKPSMLFEGIGETGVPGIPGSKAVAGQLTKIGNYTVEQLATRLESTKSYLPKIVGEPNLAEQVMVRDEVLGTLQKTMLDYTSSPDIINIQSAAQRVEGLAGEAAFNRAVQSRNFWFAMNGESSVRMATQASRALAEKFGMTLEQALDYTMQNGQKVYKNPQMVQIMREMAQDVFHYREGVLTSPLVKTLNVVWFPFRFQAKTIGLMSEWLGGLQPVSRMAVINNWVNFANWAGTDEGIKWRRTNRNMLYQILNYSLAYGQIGQSIEAVSNGRIFGGNTGLIGGVPFGFMVNIARELSYLPGDPNQFDPKTGRPFMKETPRNVPSTAALSVALEQLVIQILPGMPFYTLTGGVISGVSPRGWVTKLIRMGVGGAQNSLEGRDPTQGYQMLQRDFMRVPMDYSRIAQ